MTLVAVVEIVGLELEPAAMFLGFINGMVYGLLAVGIVLVYRATKVINFAHGQIGAFGAAIMGIAVLQWNLPYWIAFVIALASGATVGALVEFAVVRRLRRAPLVMSIVATIGVGQFLLGFGSALNSSLGSGSSFPVPPGFPQFDVGALVVSSASSATLFMTPVLVIGLVVFFRKSRFGLAIRASAANTDAAELSGVPARRMASLAWGLAGAVSTMTAVLVLPSKGFTSVAAFGPSLLFYALVGAVIGRMSNLPWALAGGIAIGVLEGTLQWNYQSSGPTSVVLFVVVLVALLFQRPPGGREREKGSYEAVQPWRAVPDAFRAVPLVRYLGAIAAAVGLAIAVAAPLVATQRGAVIMSGILSFSLVGLAIVVLTGHGGQVSLGQFALAAVGGVVAIQVAQSTRYYALAFIAAGVVAAAVSLLVGLPALRVKGLMLAVTTLAFAQTTGSWLLAQSWMLGDGETPERPGFGSYYFDSSKRYYYFSLIVFVIGVVIAWNYRRGGLGRALVAVRDNEDAARSFTIRATRTKLLAFSVAGFLSGLGGALYVFSLTLVTSEAFPLASNIDVVALTAIGGIGILAGPLLGALYIVGLPAVVNLDSAAIAVTSLGWVVLVVVFPGGLAQAVAPIRDRSIDWLVRRSGLDPAAIRAERGAGGDATTETTTSLDQVVQLRSDDARVPGAVLLEARGLTRTFGALVAVDGVDLDVHEGEILGLIGPNGAGKSTLFELLSGFTTPDRGTISFAGRDISRLSPEARGHLGMIRSFQDSALFPTLTVHETLMLAQSRTDPTRFVPSMLGLPGEERSKHERARELASLMGLESYAGHQIGELSTGTRRIVELASLVALEPRLLMLDEPASGIAQRETEALGDVLRRIKEYLDVTLVLIEHDMPLIMGISDRMVAMSAGRVIAEGTPVEVRSAPEVVVSYLGGTPEEVLEAKSKALTTS